MGPETWVQSLVTKDFINGTYTSLLITQQYKVSIKGKVEQSWERCSSYWKGSLSVALDFGRQIYLPLL